MADHIPDDELDGILDGALEAFQSAPQKTALAVTEGKGEKSPAELKTSGEEPSQAADEVGISPELHDEATKAFDDAVKALGDLGLKPPEGGEGEDVNEADMKLVEEFMTSLGSLGGLGAPGGKEGVPGGDGKDAANGLGGDGGGQNMEKLVESIVGHLLSEDVLKAPMLQMREAYAEWLPKHAEGLSAEELGRYTTQQELVGQICENYESGAESGVIMELLSKMQETGSPPAEVMKGLSTDADNGEVPGLPGMPGMAAPELGKMAESCAMQ